MAVTGTELALKAPIESWQVRGGHRRCSHCLHEQNAQRKGSVGRMETLVNWQNQKLTVDVAGFEMCHPLALQEYHSSKTHSHPRNPKDKASGRTVEDKAQRHG